MLQTPRVYISPRTSTKLRCAIYNGLAVSKPPGSSKLPSSAQVCCGAAVHATVHHLELCAVPSTYCPSRSDSLAAATLPRRLLLFIDHYTTETSRKGCLMAISKASHQLHEQSATGKTSQLRESNSNHEHQLRYELNTAIRQKRTTHLRWSPNDICGSRTPGPGLARLCIRLTKVSSDTASYCVEGAVGQFMD